MDVLKYFPILFVLCFSELTQAQKNCSSSQEFTSTYEYLLQQKHFTLPTTEILKAALKVSENCTGASKKFQKMLNTLVQTGVDHNRALLFAIEYSAETEQSVDVFLSLFEGLVLEKKFNLPFYQAFETAEAFATKSKVNKAVMKKDFLGFLGFCFDDPDGAQLPLETCRQLALQYIDLQSLYPDGVFAKFKKMFVFLRTQKSTGLPIVEALKLTQQILKHGPKSDQNFIDSYNYGLEKLNMKPAQALTLAMKIASYSNSGEIHGSSHVR